MTKTTRTSTGDWGRAARRVFALHGLGIAPRLVITLFGVVLLAATANYIVENGATAVERAIAPSTLPAAPAHVTAVARDTATRPTVARSQLVLAWGQFDEAVRQESEAASPASFARLQLAKTELERSAGEISGRYPAARHDLDRTLRTHESTAAALTALAHQRSQLLTTYSTRFVRLDARLQGSIDGAWKILGRVVARQSVLKLNDQLDDIQSRFATRNLTGNAGGTGPLEGAEQAFLVTLQKNAPALRRSQGAEWLSAMSDDFSQLVDTRRSLVDVEVRLARTAQTFLRESEALGPLLSRIVDAVMAAESKSPSWHTPADSPAGVAEAARVELAAANSKRALIAWISLGVIAALAYLCVVTIRSVVRPMRRLLQATRRVAQGKDPLPVPSGGIREFDELGDAFNAMAAELSAARAANRDALLLLETKVDERTRALQELAERDPLTGLANRRQLLTALNASLERAEVYGGLVGAFFLDIDNFKTLNDSLGHAYGDRVLTQIAARLEATAASFGFAARLGGDEFMIVHEDAEVVDDILAAGTRIVDAFAAPIAIDGREISVSVSVGASVYPLHERTVEALLRAADAALFDAKAMGRRRLTMFTPELLVKASNKFAIEQRLRRAIEKREFELFFQPEIDVHTFEVTLVEALIRWRTPDGSYHSPAEFLGVAEESGLIMEIDDWVLRAAIETAASWHYGAWPEARVSINVSPRQFLDYRFIDKLSGLLAEFRLPARCIELELTESILQTGAVTVNALAQLRELGLAIALDDFGTGYSSLASLEQLPLTRIKLDRSLIARMDSSPRSASIARATIGLCDELGLAVTAEGVERLEQFTALIGYSSMSLQGYLLSPPVARDELVPLLARIPTHCEELLLMSREAATAVGTATGITEPQVASR